MIVDLLEHVIVEVPLMFERNWLLAWKLIKFFSPLPIVLVDSLAQAAITRKERLEVKPTKVKFTAEAVCNALVSFHQRGLILNTAQNA